MKLHGFSRKRQFAASLILMMLLFACALKAVVPAGFMPENKSGTVELVICSGMGEKTIIVPQDEAPDSDHSDHKAAKEICAYQVLASGKFLIPAPAADLTAPHVLSSFIKVFDNHLAQSAGRISFDARGPPSA